MTFMKQAGALSAALVLVSALAAQGKKDTIDSKEVAKQLKEYKSILLDKKNKMGALDTKATAIVNKLLNDFEKLEKKDQAKFAKTLGDTFKWAKRSPQNSKLYQMAIRVLGKTGVYGSKVLAKSFEHRTLTPSGKKKKEEWQSVRELILEQLGATKDEKYIDFLLDVALKNAESDAFMAKAGGALGNFDESSLKLRKSIVKELAKKFSNIYGQANRNVDPGDQNRATWESRLRAVSGPWNSTLQKLTGQNFRKPTEWMKFWNKNKSKNWDKLKRS